MTRPTGQVPLLLFPLILFRLFHSILYKVPSTYVFFPSQSLFFIYFYTPRFSLLRFLFWTIFPFLPLCSFLSQFPPSSVLSYSLVYILFLTSVVTSALAFTYYFLFTGSFHSLFSDSFSFCVSCIPSLPSKTPHYRSWPLKVIRHMKCCRI